MLTNSAGRSLAPRRNLPNAVTTIRALTRSGWTSDQIRRQIEAARWQRIGSVIILHNGVPSSAELRSAATVLQGPRAALTAFTALEEWGLRGWERDPIHVLVPRGARVRRPHGLTLRIHYIGAWADADVHAARRLQRPAQAAVIAATTFAQPRPACAILAATVQQRLVRAQDLVDAVTGAIRVRHRSILLAAAFDIAAGAQALSEIDFARLCRAARLPVPVRQAVRTDQQGRRRYLDVEWVLADGRRVAVEVDGALHLIAPYWWADQLRQNELVIAGASVLRFPSVVVRCEPELVIDQLRRALSTP